MSYTIKEVIYYSQTQTSKFISLFGFIKNNKSNIQSNSASFQKKGLHCINKYFKLTIKPFFFY